MDHTLVQIALLEVKVTTMKGSGSWRLQTNTLSMRSCNAFATC